MVTNAKFKIFFKGKAEKVIKTVSAEHSSNKGKNKVTKKKNSWHGNIFEYSLEELIETSALKLTAQEKIEFEVAHILLKRTFHVSLKQSNTCFKPFTKFHINFLENA